MNRKIVVPSIIALIGSTALKAEIPQVEGRQTAAEALTIDVEAYANPCGVWIYRVTEGTERYQWKVVGQGPDRKGGKPIFLMQEFDPRSGYPNDQMFLLADLSKGLYDAGGVNDYGDRTETTFFWNPPVPRLMKVFVPGVAYTQNHMRRDLSGDSIRTRLTTREDTVSVPYGKGIKCYKSTQVFTIGSKNYTFQNWYAKHLGLVKRVQEDGTVWDLISYQGAPWLMVEQPVDSSLYDNVSTKSFGTATVGTIGRSLYFTIRNLGTKSLSGLMVTKNGMHDEDFVVGKVAADMLRPGESVRVKVTFKPLASGLRKAMIHVSHSGSLANPFDIGVTGSGVN